MPPPTQDALQADLLDNYLRLSAPASSAHGKSITPGGGRGPCPLPALPDILTKGPAAAIAQYSSCLSQKCVDGGAALQGLLGKDLCAGVAGHCQAAVSEAKCGFACDLLKNDKAGRAVKLEQVCPKTCGGCRGVAKTNKVGVSAGKSGAKGGGVVQGAVAGKAGAVAGATGAAKAPEAVHPKVEQGKAAAKNLSASNAPRVKDENLEQPKDKSHATGVVSKTQQHTTSPGPQAQHLGAPRDHTGSKALPQPPHGSAQHAAPSTSSASGPAASPAAPSQLPTTPSQLPPPPSGGPPVPHHPTPLNADAPHGLYDVSPVLLSLAIFILVFGFLVFPLVRCWGGGGSRARRRGVAPRRANANEHDADELMDSTGDGGGVLSVRVRDQTLVHINHSIHCML